MEKPNDIEDYEYLSRDELLQRLKIKRTCLLQKIRVGAFLPPVYFGRHPNFIKHEVDYFLKKEFELRVRNGKPNPKELKALISEIVAQR